VKGPDARFEIWAIEAGSPNILLGAASPGTRLKVGDKIVVDGYQSKDGSHRAQRQGPQLPTGNNCFSDLPGPDGAPYECSGRRRRREVGEIRAAASAPP